MSYGFNENKTKKILKQPKMSIYAKFRNFSSSPSGIIITSLPAGQKKTGYMTMIEVPSALHTWQDVIMNLEKISWQIRTGVNESSDGIFFTKVSYNILAEDRPIFEEDMQNSEYFLITDQNGNLMSLKLTFDSSYRLNYEIKNLSPNSISTLLTVGMIVYYTEYVNA